MAGGSAGDDADAEGLAGGVQLDARAAMALGISLGAPAGVKPLKATVWPF
jgi:hypothetical protein